MQRNWKSWMLSLQQLKNQRVKWWKLESLAATKDVENGGGGCGEGRNQWFEPDKSLQLIDFTGGWRPKIICASKDVLLLLVSRFMPAEMTA